jgi:hypothetical protein
VLVVQMPDTNSSLPFVQGALLRFDPHGHEATRTPFALCFRPRQCRLLLPTTLRRGFVLPSRRNPR